MRLAKHPVIMQRELFPRGQLSAAGVAREARQVVDLLPGLAHPVGGRDASAALGALGTEGSVDKAAAGGVSESGLRGCAS